MALYSQGRRLPLCCPMCYKVYQENPARYGGTAEPGPAPRNFAQET